MMSIVVLKGGTLPERPSRGLKSTRSGEPDPAKTQTLHRFGPSVLTPEKPNLPPFGRPPVRRGDNLSAQRHDGE